jgi:hypothetical protein
LAGSRLDAPEVDGLRRTALFMASRNGHLPVVEALQNCP